MTKKVDRTAEKMASYQNYRFLKGRTDSNPGLLILEESYQMTCQTTSKDKLTFYYACQHYQTMAVKCPARAVVKVYEELGPVVTSLDGPVHDRHKCLPDKPKILAMSMRDEMKKMVIENPLMSVGEVMRVVKLTYFDKYGWDSIWEQLVACLGCDGPISRSLYRAREKLIGKDPKNRDELDPYLLDAKLNGPDSTLVILDSDKLENWRSKVSQQNLESSFQSQ